MRLARRARSIDDPQAEEQQDHGGPGPGIVGSDPVELCPERPGAEESHRRIWRPRPAGGEAGAPGAAASADLFMMVR